MGLHIYSPPCRCVSVVDDVTCTWELVHSRYVTATALDPHKDSSNCLSLIHKVDGKHMVDARISIVSYNQILAT